MSRPNPKKDSFLKSIPSDTIETASEKFFKISFNFQFFDNSQSAGQDFCGWSKEQLVKLLEKLKFYCFESLMHWKLMPIGQGKNHVLEVYGNFPINTDFLPPKHVPADVKWARFRLEGDMRLIGFVIDSEKCTLNKICPEIFYVVFLDEHHRFYKSR